MPTLVVIIFVLLIVSSKDLKTIYNEQFRGNVLIIGKTGCRKTYFVQKLAANFFFFFDLSANYN